MTDEKEKDCGRCLFNEQVLCEERTRVCKKCGWNPDIAEKRKQEQKKEE